MVLIKSNDQLTAEEQLAATAEREAEVAAQEGNKLNQSLIATLRNRWEDSVRNKKEVETQFFKNMDQVSKTYDSEKLAAIREIGGSEVFIGVTESKSRHAKAWIRDALFQPGKKPWSVRPTPVPDVPKQLISQITGEFVSNTLRQIQMQAQASNVQIDMPSAVREIQNSIPELKNRIDAEIKTVVWDRCTEMEKEVDDKLVDGGWYDAINQCIPDIVRRGAGGEGAAASPMRVSRCTLRRVTASGHNSRRGRRRTAQSTKAPESDRAARGGLGHAFAIYGG